MKTHVMMVIVFEGVIALIIVVGSLVLSYYGKSVPEPIWGVVGASLGSLGTLLTGHRISDFTGPTRTSDLVAAFKASEHTATESST